MTELDRQIRARVDAFVLEIGDLVRRAALEAVSEALGKPARAAARDKPPSKTRARGNKRSSSELDSLASRIVRHVGDHPGSGASEIAKALGVATRDLVLPTKKLVSSGDLTTKGQKRATKYFRPKR
ncbi:MAG: hypothetical protein IT377_17230 [Polyangiaceae bacterium]|nr:hypothetical protein [Polyangiaceae bacterium]